MKWNFLVWIYDKVIIGCCFESLSTWLCINNLFHWFSKVWATFTFYSNRLLRSVNFCISFIHVHVFRSFSLLPGLFRFVVMFYWSYNADRFYLKLGSVWGSCCFLYSFWLQLNRLFSLQLELQVLIKSTIDLYK